MSAAEILALKREKLAVLKHFAVLEDPRQSSKILYPLDEIVLLTVCGAIAGADDVVETVAWGRERLEFLRRYLPFRDEIPSHDTLTHVLNLIDAGLFNQCFANWVETLRDDLPEVIAVDGKTSRGTHDRPKERKPLHLVSAWASRQRLVLGQEATAEKSNEITAIPLLLERLVLKGAVVTIDAMGTQTEIAAAILAKDGDYCLSLKANWPLLHGEVERYFADPDAPGLLTMKDEVEKDHGRLEIRRHRVCHAIAWLFSDKSHPGEIKFPGLTMIGMVESETTRGGKTTVERRYYLCSKLFQPAIFAAIVRSHWGIENRLHWTLDVIFDEDRCRLRTGDGPQNMSTIRHIAMNILAATKTKTSLKVRRKKAGWNSDYLGEILAGTG